VCVFAVCGCVYGVFVCACLYVWCVCACILCVCLFERSSSKQTGSSTKFNSKQIIHAWPYGLESNFTSNPSSASECLFGSSIKATSTGSKLWRCSALRPRWFNQGNKRTVMKDALLRCLQAGNKLTSHAFSMSLRRHFRTTSNTYINRVVCDQ